MNIIKYLPAICFLINVVVVVCVVVFAKTIFVDVFPVKVALNLFVLVASGVVKIDVVLGVVEVVVVVGVLELCIVVFVKTVFTLKEVSVGLGEEIVVFGELRSSSGAMSSSFTHSSK